MIDTMKESRRTFLKQGLMGIAALEAASLPFNHAAAATRKKSGTSASAKRILMLSLDGICVEGFVKASTPNLDALLAQGTLSLDTRVVMPSVTLPNWTSHLSGSGPELHGVGDNSWTPDNFKLPPVEADAEGYYPSVFKVLKDNVPDVKTAFYYNWFELFHPYNRKYFDEVSFEENDSYTGNYAKALEFMKANRNDPTVVFLYSVHTDHAGHRYGWMSPEYIAAIEEADAAIGSLLSKMADEGLTDGTHFMFLTDHGGIGKGHGGMTVNEMIVPWGITGPGISSGLRMQEPNNTVNTASVILRLFGLDQPLCWTGEIPSSIFSV